MPIAVAARRKVIASRKFCLSRYEPSEYLQSVERSRIRPLIVRLCLKPSRGSRIWRSASQYDPVRSEINCRRKAKEGATRLSLVAVTETCRDGVVFAPNGLPGEEGKPFPRVDRVRPEERLDDVPAMKYRMCMAPSSPIALAPSLILCLPPSGRPQRWRPGHSARGIDISPARRGGANSHGSAGGPCS